MTTKWQRFRRSLLETTQKLALNCTELSAIHVTPKAICVRLVLIPGWCRFVLLVCRVFSHCQIPCSLSWFSQSLSPSKSWQNKNKQFRSQKKRTAIRPPVTLSTMFTRYTVTSDPRAGIICKLFLTFSDPLHWRSDWQHGIWYIIRSFSTKVFFVCPLFIEKLVKHYGPFLRSSTDSDFSRPVRPVRSHRFYL